MLLDLAELLFDAFIRQSNKEDLNEHEFAFFAVTLLSGRPMLSRGLLAGYIKLAIMSTDLADLLRTFASVAAVAMSGLSVWFTGRLWRQSNRPVVSAMVRTHSGGNVSILYELAVINGGTRPAVTVRLVALQAQVVGAMEPAALSEIKLAPLKNAVLRCFSEEGLIPLLLNGQTVTNSFGVTGNHSDGGSLWRIGAAIPVEIKYCDLEGRSYTSAVVLRIRDTAAFAGGMWGESP